MDGRKRRATPEVGGRLNQQENFFIRLDVGGCEVGRVAWPARNLKSVHTVLDRALSCLRPRGLPTTVSQGRFLENPLPLWGGRGAGSCPLSRPAHRSARSQGLLMTSSKK